VGFVLPAALLEVAVATLAIDGTFDPPHPDAAKASPAKATRSTARRALQPAIAQAKHAPLKRL
jgi:hypothetical protein